MTERPNILLIYVDDLGYGDLGCYGATKVHTPNIDRLAREGRLFTDAHGGSAVCTPSRYALLTGQYAFRIGNWLPVFQDDGLLIDPEQINLPGILKENGYSTACIGKWHLGFGRGRPDWNGELKPGPLETGFDYYFGVPIVNSHPPFVYVENHRVLGLDPQDPLTFGPVHEIMTRPYPEKYNIDQVGGARAAHRLYVDEEICTTLTQKAIEWITANLDQPFFLYFSTTNIHHPFTPHPRFLGTSDCGLYGDSIHELDWSVGELLRVLDEQSLTDNTLVIFASDNGGMLNQGGIDAWDSGHRLNGELLGFKFDAWEGGHRVPFLARWCGKIPPGTVSDQLISSVDLLATIASILGVDLEDGDGKGILPGPDSFNILPAMIGQPDHAIRDHLVIQPRQPTHLALRTGEWVYIPAQGPGGFADDGAYNALKWFCRTRQVNSDITPQGVIRADAPPAQLYHLGDDLSQARNVYNEYPQIVAELDTFLKRIIRNGRSRP